MKKKITVSTLIGILMFSVASISAYAAYSLFDDASIVAGGNPGMAAQAVSDGTPGWGGLDFDDMNGQLLSSLTTLSTDFNVTDDNCGAGAPRFSINVDENGNSIQEVSDGNIFVYLGAAPNFNTCTPSAWVSSGNLILDPDLRWDTSQVGGTFYDSYANAIALMGSKQIFGISLVVDSGWNSVASGGDGEQTIKFDNVQINNALYDFEPTPTPTLNPFATPAECTGTYGAPIVGTNGANNINGTNGNDLIFALGGADRVDGKGGNDCIVAGGGADFVKGNNGNDVILGGDGADDLRGENGTDSLYGESGADSLRGGNHADTLVGGTNSDSARGEGGSDTCDAESENSCEL